MKKISLEVKQVPKLPQISSSFNIFHFIEFQEITFERIERVSFALSISHSFMLSFSEIFYTPLTILSRMKYLSKPQTLYVYTYNERAKP